MKITCQACHEIFNTDTGLQMHNCPVNPSHYRTGGIETIDFMKAKLSPEGFRGYLAGNVVKYITRYEHKNGTVDLRKAEWYLQRLIAEVGRG